MENLPPKIGRIPNTSSKIPIGAMTNAMLAYVMPAWQELDNEVSPVPFWSISV